MQALKHKLRSRRGASITFALLLFLVCAVISSIVIVAATAVGGRASRMAEMDQRYYAVNSAAELLRNVIEEQEITVTTGTKVVNTVNQDKAIVTAGTAAAEPPAAKITLNGADTTSPEQYLVTATAIQFARNGLSEAERLSLPEPATPADSPLSAKEGTSDVPALAVGIAQSTLSAPANGILALDLTSTNKSEKGVYKLTLIFKANSTSTTDEHTEYGTPVPKREGGKVVEGQYTMTQTVTRTTTTTVRWKLIDLLAPMATVAPASMATAAPEGGGT